MWGWGRCRVSCGSEWRLAGIFWKNINWVWWPGSQSWLCLAAVFCVWYAELCPYYSAVPDAESGPVLIIRSKELRPNRLCVLVLKTKNPQNPTAQLFIAQSRIMVLSDGQQLLFLRTDIRRNGKKACPAVASSFSWCIGCFRKTTLAYLLIGKVKSIIVEEEATYKEPLKKCNGCAVSDICVLLPDPAWLCAEPTVATRAPASPGGGSARPLRAGVVPMPGHSSLV